MGPIGSFPLSKLLQGTDGNFYGSTIFGGINDRGTVFKLTPSGTLTTMVNFNGFNGRYPLGGLVQDGNGGDFYGTTFHGGTNVLGRGTAFKMSPTGGLTTLIYFTETNGADPSGGFVQGTDGNFYGTTSAGSPLSGGNCFRMTPAGTLTPLLNGIGSSAALILATDGNFYGITSRGGSNFKGSVLKITPSGTLTTLVNFNGTDGAAPRAKLFQNSAGDFYGTTSEGGSGSLGTVFKMTASGALTTLVNFINSNGRNPIGGLTQGSDGNLYGTTSKGGTTSGGNPAGGGQIYRLRFGAAVTPLKTPQITLQPGGSATLVFLDGPGLTFTVQRSINLRDWDNLTTMMTNGSGILSYVDATPPADKAFYRIAKP